MYFLYLNTGRCWHRSPVDMRISIPDRHVLGPHNHLHKEKRISLPVVNRAGHADNHALYSSVEIKERVEI